jgi:hypothetical protein
MTSEFPDQIVVGDYHIGDAWQIPYIQTRWSYYSGSGTPTVVFDGLQQVIGAGSCSSAASAYRTKIQQRLTQTNNVSPIGIDGIFSFDESTVSLTANFAKLDAVTLSNMRAYLLVLEDHLISGPYEYNHVVRAEYDQAVTLTNVGDNVTVNASFPLGSWNTSNLDCICFIQNTATKEVYQAGRLPRVQDYAVAFDAVLASVPAGNGTASFHGFVTNTGTVNDQLTFSLNNTWGWPAEFMVAGDAGYHSTPVTKPIAVGGALEVWVRVTTDAALRIGSGGFVVHSATSDRTQQTTLRIFNSSPAILMVDTDGNRSDEIPITSGLTAGGFLFDHWDSYNDHGGINPNTSAANGYDIMLWHEGWANEGLAEADQQTIMNFMDAGHGVILSGQDYLTGISAGTFTSDYFGLASWVVNTRSADAVGVAGDPISDGMSFALTYPQWNLDRADNLTAGTNGTIIMTASADQDRIAIRADNGTARSVFFAYALNAMPASPDPNNVKTLLDRSVAWIMQTSGQSVEDGVLAGIASGVREIAPNPFAPLRSSSSSTTIRLRITDAAANRSARLDVVDLNGRLVRNLVNGVLPAGMQSRTWDGRDASGTPVGAGIYYVRFSNDQGSNSARVVLMR